MTDPAPAYRTLYQQLCELPDNMVGEIYAGSLHAHPRPSASHARATSILGGSLTGPFDLGKGGPGGWWILDEPELHLRRDELVLVPDIAGWRRERLARLPRDHRFETVPDWVCEVLSRSTAQHDRLQKLPIYARHGVAHLWLIDTDQRTLEVFVLDNDEWKLLEQHSGSEEVSAPPFEAVAIDLGSLWVR